MEDRRRSKLRWTAAGLAAVLALAAVLVTWIRDSPFERRFRAFAAEHPLDPDVLLLRGLADDDRGALSTAADISDEPGFAAIAAMKLDEAEDATDADVAAALARWQRRDPGNGVPDLVRAARLIARRDVEAAAPLIESGLAGPAPAFRSEFARDVHVRMQRRLGTRDPLALLRRDDGSMNAALRARKIALVARALAIDAAFDGRLDEALARAGAVRVLGERLVERSRSAIDALVGIAIADVGADLEARAAIWAGEPARARAVLEGMRARRALGAEASAGSHALTLLYTHVSGLAVVRELDGRALDGSTSRWSWLRDETRVTLAMARARINADRLFAFAEAPEGELAYLRALGRGAPPGATPGNIDVIEAMLATPAAFGPPPPGDGPPPAELTRWLSRGAPPGASEDVVLGAVVLPLARYGPRALATVSAALPETGTARFDALLPALAAAGHPAARAGVRAALEAGSCLTEPYGAPIAARILGGDDLAAPLAALAVREIDEESRVVEERAFRAIAGRSLVEVVGPVPPDGGDGDGARAAVGKLLGSRKPSK